MHQAALSLDASEQIAAALADVQRWWKAFVKFLPSPGFVAGTPPHPICTFPTSVLYSDTANRILVRLWCPTPRMAGLKGEAGESPALSRSCKLIEPTGPINKPDRPPGRAHTTFAEGGWSMEDS